MALKSTAPHHSLPSDNDIEVMLKTINFEAEDCKVMGETETSYYESLGYDFVGVFGNEGWTKDEKVFDKTAEDCLRECREWFNI